MKSLDFMVSRAFRLHSVGDTAPWESSIKENNVGILPGSSEPLRDRQNSL